ncbi:hypothetical protein ACLS0R_06520, partial [Comamonas jiangduensis]|uniref:hypothetical protein n=1 Tax=Comamonas jiangduensis TaxID=1194168 RepID=UPI003BF85B06
ICDCRCLGDSNMERKACSGFLSRGQQSLHSFISSKKIARSNPGYFFINFVKSFSPTWQSFQQWWHSTSQLLHPPTQA